MKHQLIIIEGLPGVGKTTTATLVNQYLEKNNIKTDCYLEGNFDHPVDYEGVAYYSHEDYKQLIEDYQLSNKLEQYSKKKENGYFIYYLKYRNELKEFMSVDTFQKIGQQDIYALDLNQHMEIMLNRWETFVEETKATDKTYIFECCFLQNPITTAMIRDNAATDEIKQYIHHINELIQPLNPLLVYLEQDDIGASFEKIMDERSQQWQDFFIDYYTTQNYGKAHNYTGLNGTIEILRDRKKLEKAIVDTLPLEKLIINNTDYESDRILNQLHTLVGL